MTTIPISEIVPLVQWIQTYHVFRTKLDLILYQTGWGLEDLHLDRLGAATNPGVWETNGYKVLVHGFALTFEVKEGSSVDEALAAFKDYQESLFRD